MRTITVYYRLLGLLFCFFTLTSALANGKEKEKEKVKWLSIEEAYAKAKEEPKKILIDLYTDWCGWCKTMDRETYSNEKVAAYINANYYPVKFNAEQRKSVRFGERNFVFIPRGKGGVHELAIFLTQNNTSYPTTVFLDERMAVIQPLPGYFKAKDFYEVVTFFGGNHYQEEPFDQFKKSTFTEKY